METTNSFLASYKEQLDSFSLPVRLADAYQLCDCLKKSTHKEIYVLTDAKETQFVLKRGTGNQLPLLKQEYQGALSDIMNNIRMTIDWVDEQENAALEQ